MLRLLILLTALLLVGCRVKRTTHEMTTEQATRTLEVSRLSRLAEVRTDLVIDYSRAHIIEYDTAGRVMRVLDYFCTLRFSLDSPFLPASFFKSSMLRFTDYT